MEGASLLPLIWHKCAEQALRAIVAAPYLLLAASVVAGWLPAACLAAAAVSLPGAAQLLRFCAEHRLVPDAIR